MRELRKYRLGEWIRLAPFRHGYKEVRNSLVSFFYVNTKILRAEDFSLEIEDGKVLAITVAYEQPWAVKTQLSLFKKFVKNSKLIVCDNSKTEGARKEIKKIAQSYGVCYVALPKNRTRHPNRNHALALQWAYKNIVQKIRPEKFCLLDHDIFPLKDIDLSRMTSRTMPIKGQIKDKSEQDPGAWSIWVGFLFFERAITDNVNLNFMYDISRRLDTGGKNYERLYRHIGKGLVDSVPVKVINVCLDDEKIPMQLFDGAWMHVGTIGYSKTAGDRICGAEKIIAAIDDGKRIEHLVCKGDE